MRMGGTGTYWVLKTDFYKKKKKKVKTKFFFFFYKTF
jgi:hypothetical protein